MVHPFIFAYFVWVFRNWNNCENFLVFISYTKLEAAFYAWAIYKQSSLGERSFSSCAQIWIWIEFCGGWVVWSCIDCRYSSRNCQLWEKVRRPPFGKATMGTACNLSRTRLCKKNVPILTFKSTRKYTLTTMHFSWIFVRNQDSTSLFQFISSQTSTSHRLKIHLQNVICFCAIYKLKNLTSFCHSDMHK